jgi:phosphoserine phosphatase RsbU/P
VPDLAADLVDSVRLNDGRLACFILDVPGRGQQAAELMAAIASVTMRTLTECGSPGKALRLVEDNLKSRMLEVPLVTSICIAILDHDRSTVTISVAGHCPAYHFSGETMQALVGTGMSGPPLGQLHDACQEFEVYLADDDALLLCSDGITKIPHRQHGLVKQDQVHELFVQAANRDRATLAIEIAGQVEYLRDTAPLQDDVALLTIHKTDVRQVATRPFQLEDDWQAQ